MGHRRRHFVGRTLDPPRQATAAEIFAGGSQLHFFTCVCCRADPGPGAKGWGPGPGFGARGPGHGGPAAGISLGGGPPLGGSRRGFFPMGGLVGGGAPAVFLLGVVTPPAVFPPAAATFLVMVFSSFTPMMSADRGGHPVCGKRLPALAAAAGVEKK